MSEVSNSTAVESTNQALTEARVFNPLISIGSARDNKIVEDVLASEVIDVIAKGFDRWGLKSALKKFRQAKAELEKDPDNKKLETEAKKAKQALPAALWSGVFISRSSAQYKEHSGLICLDLDHLGDNWQEVWDRITTSPYVWAAFRSPSGDGMKILVRVLAKAELHDQSYRSARAHIIGLSGTVPDPKAKDIGRLCFLTHDYDLYGINPDAEELPLLPEAEPPAAQDKPMEFLSPMQEYAAEVLDIIKWETPVRAQVVCPGIDNHNTRNQDTDCNLHLDGAINLHCFHQSCKNECKEAEKKLTTRIAELVTAKFPEHDVDRARAFETFLKGDARFIAELKEWRLWYDYQWKADGGALITWRGTEYAQLLEAQAEAVQGPGRKTAKALANAANGKRAIDSAVGLTKCSPQIRAAISTFDSDPYLFGVQNGVIDLRTGVFRESSRDDMIFKRSKAIYIPGAPCPLWESALQRILPQEGLVPYLQRAIGYSLSGLVTEQVLFFLYGQGSNGKSTFIEVLSYIFGDYFWKTVSDIFLKSYGSTGDKQMNQMAALPEKRLVVAQEMDDDAEFDSAKVKDLTGGDTITARKLFCEPFNFAPTHKLWFYGNVQPRCRALDDGFWRRVQLIPFEQQIPKEERNQQIIPMLLMQKPGILNWAIEGFRSWQQQGLNPPKCITESVESYRSDSDPIAEFIGERCDLIPGARVTNRDIYQSYVFWCNENNVKFPFGDQRFLSHIRKLSGVKAGRFICNDGKVRRGLEGIFVRPMCGEKPGPRQARQVISTKPAAIETPAV